MSEPLQRSVAVRCSVERAFVAFTERIDLWWPPSHRRFAGSKLVLEARAGGRFYERAATGEEVTLGEVLRCERPHALAYSWYPGAIAGPTTVEIRFTAQGAQTLVEVTHSEGLSELGERWPERVGLFGRAWSHVLPAYVAHAEATEP